MKQQVYQLLADIFDYPNPAMPLSVNRLMFLLEEEEPKAAAALAEFQSVLETAGIARLQELYIQIFDFRADCSLYVGHYLFGESGRRGQFLAELTERYRERQLPATSDMPDHISCLLRYLAALEPGEEAGGVDPRLPHSGDFPDYCHESNCKKPVPYRARSLARPAPAKGQRPSWVGGICVDIILFVAFPYLAVILAIGVGIYRKVTNPFSYSSLSSQLLENKRLFWGSVPWHYGITLVLLGHLIPWLIPGVARYVLADPIRLVVLELLGLALSLFTAFGLVVLIVRRLPGAGRAEAVTSWMDWVLLFFFALQVLSGIGVALFDRWGSLWFLSSVTPWLWSPSSTTGYRASRGSPGFHSVSYFVRVRHHYALSIQPPCPHLHNPA